MVSTAIYGALKTLRYADVVRLVQEATTLLSSSKNGNKVASDEESPSDPGLHSDGSHNKGRKLRRSLMNMGFVGMMRFATVVLGLVSLKYVAASFTETVKASAPFFTVIIAYFMLGEKTGLPAMASLVPVAGGLALASATELSFNMVGFSAAVATNVIECVQNVFSKRLLAGEYTASQLQFYTSLTALILQAPIFLWNLSRSPAADPLHSLENAANSTLASLETDGSSLFGPNQRLIALLWIDGVLYHLQSVVAYVVMSYLSPVTVSVVNTLKRAMIIWISIQVFGNEVTGVTVLGTVICLLGAFCYNWAK